MTEILLAGACVSLLLCLLWPRDQDGYREWVELGRPFSGRRPDALWVREWAQDLMRERERLESELADARAEVERLRAAQTWTAWWS